MDAVFVVVLTVETRPRELETSVSSVRQQTLDAEIVPILNGDEPDRDIADEIAEPGTNLGTSERQNARMNHSCGELICFLNDNAARSEGRPKAAAEVFKQADILGARGLRIVNEAGERRPSFPVTSVWSSTRPSSRSGLCEPFR